MVPLWSFERGAMPSLQIRRCTTSSRKPSKDEKLNPDQKSSMLDGYWRMEQRQIFAELTPEQQQEVRSKAKHAAEQDKKKAFPPNRNMKVGDQP